MFLGNYNATANEKCMEECYNLNGLTSLTKKPTCFKNPDKLTCIDLILTNQLNVFNTVMFMNWTFRLSLINHHWA